VQINLQFNGYQEMRNFCLQIIGEQKPLTHEELNETAKVATEIINRAEAKEEEEEKPKEPKKRKTRTTITDQMREDVMKWYNGGYSVKEVASLIGISPASVFRIINEKNDPHR